MAIMGFLVHSLQDDVGEVEARITAMSEMTTYGIEQEQYVVVVAEAPSAQMEKTVNRIQGLKGVLSIYPTYLTIEDEIDEEGNLQSNLSLFELIKKKHPADIQ